MFEVHITCRSSQAEAASAIARELHWKTSEIARDPVLGNDTYFYLTTHGTDLGQTMGRMVATTLRLKSDGVEVVREKIEVIIYDVRYTK